MIGTATADVAMVVDVEAAMDAAVDAVVAVDAALAEAVDSVAEAGSSEPHVSTSRLVLTREGWSRTCCEARAADRANSPFALSESGCDLMQPPEWLPSDEGKASMAQAAHHLALAHPEPVFVNSSLSLRSPPTFRVSEQGKRCVRRICHTQRASGPSLPAVFSIPVDGLHRNPRCATRPLCNPLRNPSGCITMRCAPMGSPAGGLHRYGDFGLSLVMDIPPQDIR